MVTSPRSIVLGSIVGVLGFAVIAQAAYMVKLQGELDAVSEKLEHAAASARAVAPAAPPKRAAPLPFSFRSSGSDDDEPSDATVTVAQRAILEAMVAAEVERTALDKQDRKSERNADHYGELRDGLVTLGIAGTEADGVEAVLIGARETRDELRRGERERELSETETTESLAALRSDTQEKLTGLLGPRWAEQMDRARDLMREARKKQRDARGSGGVFWFMPREP